MYLFDLYMKELLKIKEIERDILENQLTCCSFCSWVSSLERKVGTLGDILLRKVQCTNDHNAKFLGSACHTAPIRNTRSTDDHIFREGRIEGMVPN